MGGLLERLDRFDLVLGSRFLGRMPEMELAHKLGNILFSGLVSGIREKEIRGEQDSEEPFPAWDTGAAAHSQERDKRISCTAPQTDAGLQQV